jgi:hypothetical protein
VSISGVREEKRVQQTRKVLNRWDSVAIITAIVVDVGIYRVPAAIFRRFLNYLIINVLQSKCGYLHRIYPHLVCIFNVHN